jgi:hypothetical protein
MHQAQMHSLVNSTKHLRKKRSNSLLKIGNPVNIGKFILQDHSYTNTKTKLQHYKKREVQIKNSLEH